MENNKPTSLPLKAWLIRKMSVDTMTQERVIEAVVNHQFDSAYKALETCRSLEFSGFGKFYFNVKKAYRKLEKFKSQIAMFNKLLATDLTPTRRKNIELKMETTFKNIEYLKAQLHEN